MSLPPVPGAGAPAEAKRRIGLFGGSFDPVHLRHLALARQALTELALDELRWVPVGDAWQKARPLTAAVHRVAMLRLAIGDQPRHRIERCEVDRPGPSYTADTVAALQAAEPGGDWFLVIGADQYAGLHTWHCYEELLQRVTLAVALRPGTKAPADTRVRAAAAVRLALPPADVSASDIRARVAAGQDIGALVPPAVAEYIDRHRLYRSASGS